MMKLSFLLLTLLGLTASADNLHPLMTPQEVELRAAARNRIYAGGKDEEPLRVQPQLPLVIRKGGSGGEEPVSEPPAQDAATD